MSFDKIKVMRNAEKCLSQGKIRAAISEYKRVVENDPKDFGTMNILGDLYLKNSEAQEAVGCFTQVADYYNAQGFSQKAIAVYNKISRLKPDSVEVSAKLAQLYKSKGSFAEARVHLTALAEQYQRKGQKIEALAIWKQIADLDLNDSSTYLKIAEVYWQEQQKEEAARSFAEAGKRLSAQGQHESALAAYSRALEISRYDLAILKGYVDAQIKLDCGDDAAKVLVGILEKQPYNRDILLLLIDCYIDSENPVEAEKAIIKLVEQEPTNYPKFLDLVIIYLKNKDLDAAARILSMSSEHLLVGGQSDQFLHFTDEILASNPEHLEALRLSVRYHGWHRDESELKKSLERLAEVAQINGAVDDERNALSQLVMIAPQEVRYARRLQEMKIQYGFEGAEYNLSQTQNGSTAEIPSFENFQPQDDYSMNGSEHIFEAEYADTGENFVAQPEEKYFSFSQNGFSETVDNAADFIVEGVIDEAYSKPVEDVPAQVPTLKPADEMKIASEVESIDFYIGQGYTELAEKSINALVEQYGNRLEFAELQAKIGNNSVLPLSNGKPEMIAVKVVEEPTPQTKTPDVLSEFRNELGLEDFEAETTGDYETHYDTATAYREMGLLEDAIREFQDAINIAKPNDGTRRFFQCANLLGHCFMEKQMPNLALVWYRRGLETDGLSDDEKQALYYEIANAYEAGEEPTKAIEYFEKIYGENIDYRDVSARLKSLKAKK